MKKRYLRGSRVQQPYPAAWASARSLATWAFALANVALAQLACAQPGAAPVAAAPVRPASATVPAVPRAASETHVIEDDRVRIEETRVRGQLQRITVAPKGPPGSTIRPYEINVGAGGRDPSQDKSGAGQRVWSVLRF